MKKGNPSTTSKNTGTGVVKKPVVVHASQPIAPHHKVVTTSAGHPHAPILGHHDDDAHQHVLVPVPTDNHSHPHQGEHSEAGPSHTRRSTLPNIKEHSPHTTKHDHIHVHKQPAHVKKLTRRYDDFATIKPHIDYFDPVTYNHSHNPPGPEDDMKFSERNQGVDDALLKLQTPPAAQIVTRATPNAYRTDQNMGSISGENQGKINTSAYKYEESEEERSLRARIRQLELEAKKEEESEKEKMMERILQLEAKQEESEIERMRERIKQLEFLSAPQVQLRGSGNQDGQGHSEFTSTSSNKLGRGILYYNPNADDELRQRYPIPRCDIPHQQEFDSGRRYSATDSDWKANMLGTKIGNTGFAGSYLDPQSRCSRDMGLDSFKSYCCPEQSTRFVDIDKYKYGTSSANTANSFTMENACHCFEKAAYRSKVDDQNGVRQYTKDSRPDFPVLTSLTGQPEVTSPNLDKPVKQGPHSSRKYSSNKQEEFVISFTQEEIPVEVWQTMQTDCTRRESDQIYGELFKCTFTEDDCDKLIEPVVQLRANGKNSQAGRKSVSVEEETPRLEDDVDALDSLVESSEILETRRKQD